LKNVRPLGLGIDGDQRAVQFRVPLGWWPQGHAKTARKNAITARKNAKMARTGAKMARKNAKMARRYFNAL